eukprot:5905566-Lingulodinium_polyedra.AAC.1
MPERASGATDGQAGACPAVYCAAAVPSAVRAALQGTHALPAVPKIVRRERLAWGRPAAGAPCQ